MARPYDPDDPYPYAPYAPPATPAPAPKRDAWRYNQQVNPGTLPPGSTIDIDGTPINISPDAEWTWLNGRWEVSPKQTQSPIKGPTAIDYAPPGTPQAMPTSRGPGGDGDPYAPSGVGSSGPFPDFRSAGPFQPRDSTFDYDPYESSAPYVPGQFSYDPYAPSSWADAEREPGYDASRLQLRKQIEAGAAHRGVLRSGATLGDIYTNLDALSQQNFQRFDDRRFRDYSANRAGAFDTFRENEGNRFGAYQANESNRRGAWDANLGAAGQKFGLEYGVDRDVYDRGATDIDRGNNFRFNVAQSKFQDALARWQEQVRSLTQITTAGAQS